jgi:uncharacterized zinc-type alcohol dehydrogenase-like protein
MTTPSDTKAYAAVAADQPLQQQALTRRALRDDDVLIDIEYCGVCHSDLHTARNDWGRTVYPIVPGHEITGIVREVGSAVTRHAAGDRVAVGCIVDSCKACKYCDEQLEQYCLDGMTGTYGGVDRHDGTVTAGGYADRIVVRDEFVLRVPDSLDMAAAAPLLCAGITSYSPLRTWKVGPGSRVGVVGLGGIGHLGVKLAVALGAEVTVITRSDSKAEDAARLGAADCLSSTDRDAMRASRDRFDFILDTVPVRHKITPYLSLLRVDGPLVIVGMIEQMPEMHSGHFINRRIVTGSGIGGIAQTQEMLDFCAEHEVAPDIERIEMHEINAAYDRLARSDVRYRFVIDIGRFRGAR